MSELTKEWKTKAENLLMNRKIVKVRYLTDVEANDMGWYSRSLAFLLDNGIWVFASSDDEGNDAGALFTSDEKLPTIPVLRVGD